MDGNISDSTKSSRAKKSVREDGTLIKEADSVEFVIDRSEDNTFTNSSKPAKSFTIDLNYGPKRHDKRNKVLPLSQHQNDSNSTQE